MVNLSAPELLLDAVVKFFVLIPYSLVGDRGSTVVNILAPELLLDAVIKSSVF